MKDRQDNLGDSAPEFFREQLHKIADWIGDYREKIAERPISTNVQPGEILSQLDREPPESGVSLDKIFADIDRVIVPGVVHWAHPQFMSYFGCTTTNPGILAEMITGALNVNSMTWRTAPAATELETLVLGWLRQWLGLPSEFMGVVYDTASISTMHALATAREVAAPNTRQLGLSGRDLPRFRIYTSAQAHSSIEKGAIAIGIGEENVRRVPVDSEFRMDVAALREMIAQDRQQKFQPMAVVATVGTTSTASVDPVAEIAKICRDEKIWLHIDGAYGAGLALLPECKWITAGWSEADSLVINPHKMLFVPFDFSALYMRDVGRLRRLFTLVPEYLHLRDPVGAEINYMDYGVQLGRRFRALKAWMVWRAFGREGLAARIREHLRLAKLFAEWVKSDDPEIIGAREGFRSRFELSAPVVMGVVCFRLVAGDSDKIDNLNTQMVERINACGHAYLTQTKLHGRTVMRIGLGNVLTTEQHLRNVWEIIQRTAKEM
jgi:aromatic-L-amino-acid decarboxylase